MNKNRKHIDDFFREKLGNYAEVPPSDAWHDMDKKLDTLVPHTGISPYRWMGHIGVVSIIAIISVSLVNKFTQSSPQAALVAEVVNADNIKTVNKLELVNSSVIEDETRVASLSETSISKHESAANTAGSSHLFNQKVSELGFGESYSENADNEYVEGVTEIRRENNFDDYRGRKEVNLAHKGDVGLNDLQKRVAGEMPLYAAVAGKEGSIENSNSASRRLPEYGDNQYNAGLSDKTLKLAAAPGQAALTDNRVSGNTDVIPEKKNKIADRWGMGLKAGYQRGFNNTAASGYTLAPFVSYKLSEKVGLMVQPTAMLAAAPDRNIRESASYTRVNNDASVSAVESYVTTAVEGTSVAYYNNTKYRYTQSHDSIVKVNKTGGSYMQFELPVLLSYKVFNRLSVYGGVNLVYSKMQDVKEHTYTVSDIVNTVDTLITSKSAPVAPATTDVITYSGTPYSSYSGSEYATSSRSSLRVGAVVGVSYQYSNRWLLDATVQKTPAPANIKGGYNVNAPLSAPAFRFSVGYKLKK